MIDAMLRTFTFLIVLIVNTPAFASCPDMTGDAKDRCECMESGAVYPNPEELECKEDSDCVVIEGSCGGWIAINRTKAEAFKTRNAEILRQGSELKKGKRFEAICAEEHWCRPNWGDYGAPR